MGETIYKEHVIKTEAQMKIWCRWLLFCDKAHRLSPANSKAYLVFKQVSAKDEYRSSWLESFILKG